MEKGLSDAEIHRLGSKFDVQVREEASYLLWYIWRDRHPNCSTLQACISALSEDEDLYVALKAAYAHCGYDEIRHWKGMNLVQVSIYPSLSLSPSQTSRSGIRLQETRR